MDVVELTREWVSIESTSGREGRIGAHLADLWTRSGLVVRTQDVEGGDPAMVEPRRNVLALVDDREAPDVVFTTHMDTVPPYLPLREESGRLFGRGTCDAKGILAAQWVAFEILRQRGHERIGMLAVVGEETNSIGAKVARALLPRASYLVNGEPTSSLFASAMKGVLGVHVRCRGVAGHSAYPERAHSAVHDLVQGLSKFLARPLPGDAAFGATTANVGIVNGGVAANVIAPSASADVLVRLAAPSDEVLAVMQQDLGDAEITIQTRSERRQIYVPEGFPSAPVSFGSDVPYLSTIGVPLLVGPGSIHDAHTDHESIGIDELRSAVDTYVALGERLLAEASRARGSA